MAVNTNKTYRNQVLYSVFVRNYSEEGTFEALRRDLKRIRDLGVDIIWLMPIHPLGEKARKGSLGSPYAIRDYRAVNPEFGTLEDFKRLVEDIHSLGMKCIIDVVYNHTSPDSWLAEHHPQWFYHKEDGSFGNRVGDWTDIIDLDYSNPGLWDYQIETLKMWARIVDGFRCDVAPLVPLDFWLKARQAVEEVRPGCFWLAESVEPEFIRDMRARGLAAHSDSEMYQAFDACYDYDILTEFQGVFSGKVSLAAYAQAVDRQDGMYPANYIKLRYLENHDRSRGAHLIPDERMLRNWTAFTFFQKGLTMLYAGQEVQASHTPSLFDKDLVRWDWSKDLTPLLRKLAEIKRDPIFTDSSYSVTTLPRDILLAVHQHGEEKMVGVFSTRGESALANIRIPDGIYENRITGENVEVRDGCLAVKGEPIILRV